VVIANCGLCTLICGDFTGKTVTIDNKLITTDFQMTNGATNDYVLTSDASGNATWQSVSGFTGGSGTTITSSDTQIIFNSGGTITGSNNLTYSGNTVRLLLN